MTRKLDDPRGQVLDAIRISVRERGYPPSIQEIAEAVGLARSTVHHHLRALAETGVISRPAGRARAIVIADIHPTESGAGPVAPEPAPDPQKEIQP